MTRTIFLTVLLLALAVPSGYGAGAKTEETIIQVWGMGPATSTPAEKR